MLNHHHHNPATAVVLLIENPSSLVTFLVSHKTHYMRHKTSIAATFPYFSLILNSINFLYTCKCARQPLQYRRQRQDLIGVRRIQILQWIQRMVPTWHLYWTSGPMLLNFFCVRKSLFFIGFKTQMLLQTILGFCSHRITGKREFVGGWVDGWMDRWIDESMDQLMGWMDE